MAGHRLAWLDHLAYELFRSTGRNQLMQCVWLYDREVDRAALARTHERLVRLCFSRLIEPASLPLARPRWVRPARPPDPVGDSGDRLPPGALLSWANRHAEQPIDPVAGPPWRMALQRFTDGSTAVSIVISHLVVDALGGLRAIAAAVDGNEVPNPYLVQGRRGALAGAAADAAQILTDAPRCIAALARIARTRWRERALRRTAAPAVRAAAAEETSSVVKLAAVAATIAARDWDRCARRLGGQPGMLMPGIVATLAAKLGRIRASDGAVSLIVPVDMREGLADDRALAIAFHAMHVSPRGLETGLQPLAAPMKALLRGVRDRPDDTLAPMLPAIAWMPRSIATALVDRLFTYGDDRPVSCSNLGNLPESLGRIDGAPCARILARAVDANVTRRDLERSHGHLVAVAARYAGGVSLCIEACQLDPAPTTTAVLRAALAETLGAYGLDAVILS